MAQSLMEYNVKVFVRSSGYSQDWGYCWLPDEPSQWNKISGLIQSESPSVVLTRSSGQLILFVTGLESSEKKDFCDRPIRHSIAWICKDNDYDEKQIRAIAVQALREQELLSTQVDKCIRFSSERGFEASFLELKKMSESLLKPEEIKETDLPSLNRSPKIAKKSKESLDELASKLQQYRLPKEYEFLIVVTGVKSEKSLAEAGIWRSSSNLVKSEEWEPTRNEAESPKKFGAAILVAVLMIVALLFLIVFHPLTQEPKILPPPTPTVSPTNQVEEIPEQIQQRSSINSSASVEKDLMPLETNLKPVEN